MGKKAKTQKTDRRHLTPREVESLIQGVAESSRNSERDRCLLLLTYRHGFRVSEVCGLPLDHVDIAGRVLHVKRLKRGLSTTHPLRLDEIRAIKAWLKVRAQMKPPKAVKTLFTDLTSVFRFECKGTPFRKTKQVTSASGTK